MWKIRSLQRLFLVVPVLVMVGLLLAATAEAAQPSNPRLAEIIKKAAQEGEIVYQGPDPATGLPTADMVRDMQALTEKHFGVTIRIKVDNALTFPASVVKVLTEVKAGAPPTFDFIIQTPVSGAPLYKDNLLEAVPWVELFPHVRKTDLEVHGLALVQGTQFVLPEYNTQLVKPADVPKRWEDFLDAKWKGKLGLLVNADPWAFLSQPNAWGEEKAFAYLRKIMELNPKLGRFPEVHQRVLSGETPIAWAQFREAVLASKQKGAPVDVADAVEPSFLWIYTAMIPKGARHTNAAILLAAAMATDEGQNIMFKYHNMSSMFRPNTPAAKFAAARKYIRPDVDFHLRAKDDLWKRISAILIRK